MANERTYAILPCRELDESLAFYQTLGFKVTYHQLRPNPYAVVALEDIQIHLGGIAGFNPADSYASVIIAVPDPDALYHAFASRLRAAYGKLPVAGIPRLLRPRKRYGTVRGFTAVDPGGNWLRVYRLGDTEQDAAEEPAAGLAQVIAVAARLGDAHGDEAAALKTLDNGLRRYPDAPAGDKVRAFLYRAELAARADDGALAQASLAAARAVVLDASEQAAIVAELEQVAAIVAELSPR